MQEFFAIFWHANSGFFFVLPPLDTKHMAPVLFGTCRFGFLQKMKGGQRSVCIFWEVRPKGEKEGGEWGNLAIRYAISFKLPFLLHSPTPHTHIACHIWNWNTSPSLSLSVPLFPRKKEEWEKEKVLFTSHCSIALDSPGIWDFVAIRFPLPPSLPTASPPVMSSHKTTTTKKKNKGKHLFCRFFPPFSFSVRASLACVAHSVPFLPFFPFFLLSPLLHTLRVIGSITSKKIKERSEFVARTGL